MFYGKVSGAMWAMNHGMIRTYQFARSSLVLHDIIALSDCNRFKYLDTALGLIKIS